MKQTVPMKNSFSMQEWLRAQRVRVVCMNLFQLRLLKPKLLLFSTNNNNLKGNGDLVKLEKAYRSSQGELTRMQKHLQQMQEIKNSWDASAFQSSTDTTPQQNGGGGGYSNHSQPQQNSSPKNSGQYQKQNQNYNSGGRGYRGRGRGRGYGPGRRQTPIPPGNPKGWNRLCFWCRDFATFDDANHPIKQCPYYKEIRKDWWQHQQQTSQPNAPASQNPCPEGNQ